MTDGLGQRSGARRDATVRGLFAERRTSREKDGRQRSCRCSTHTSSLRIPPSRHKRPGGGSNAALLASARHERQGALTPSSSTHPPLQPSTGRIVFVSATRPWAGQLQAMPLDRETNRTRGEIGGVSTSRARSQKTTRTALRICPSNVVCGARSRQRRRIGTCINRIVKVGGGKAKTARLDR